MTPPPNKILVIGELNPDLIAIGLPTGPILGQEILAAGFRMVLGSASAIFACGMAKLGRTVTFVSKIGNDEFGRFCLESLEKHGISTSNVAQDSHSSTGVTVALSTGADRALVTYPGAVAELTIKDVDPDSFRGHAHLHMTSYFLQTGLQPDFGKIMNSARSAGLTTSFDPNADPSCSWQRDIWRVFDTTDIVFLNEIESQQLTGKGDPEAALAELCSVVPYVVIKLGAKGALAGNKDKKVFVPGFSVNAVDPTGAGDSFDAGFVHAFLAGREFRECLIMANACGALSTLQPGGTEGQASEDVVSEFLRDRQSLLELTGQR